MPSLKKAVEWIAENDESGEMDPKVVADLVSVALVADLFETTTENVAKKVVKLRRRSKEGLMAIDYEKLEKDIIAAVEAAKKASAGSADGGSCNFDCVTLDLPRADAPKLKALETRCGVRVYKQKWRGKIHVFLGTPGRFQGFGNTLEAQTMEKVLKSAGYKTMMYYQMD